jgi:hypothetical protein
MKMLLTELGGIIVQMLLTELEGIIVQMFFTESGKSAHMHKTTQGRQKRK